MTAFPYTVLDVFTDRPLEGNALAVVHDADGLPEATMLRFARETNLSETTFVGRPREAGADYRNRIFTTARELPFAGHPSLGTAVAVARRRGATEALYVQQTGAGLQPVEVRSEGAVWHASMLQEPAELGPELDPAAALGAAGLEPGDAHPELGPRIVSTGVPQAIVPVRDEHVLGRARLLPERLEPVLGPAGAVVLYLAALPAPGRARARAFFEGGEDPATGSAAGPLLAYLAERGVARELEIAQGAEVGRPSRLEARLEGDRVRVGGGVVAVVDGTVTL